MKYSVYRFTLDIHVTRSQVSIPVLYRDTGIRFLISLSDGGKPYVIQDGNLAVFFGKKADGTYLTRPCIINNNTEIQYDFTEQTTSYEGIVDAEIRLYGTDGKIITSPSFTIVVDPKVLRDEDLLESVTETSPLDNVILTAIEKVSNAVNKVLPEGVDLQVIESDIEIDGDLVVRENLTVDGDLEIKGATKSVSHETLTVNDNIIVTNAGSTNLNSLSGIVINTGETDEEGNLKGYGIVYEPASDSVKLGIGTITKHEDTLAEFAFAEGEAQAIVTRGDDFDDAASDIIPMWDSVKKTLVPSGKTVADFVPISTEVTANPYVYVKNPGGTQRTIELTAGATGYAIPQRLGDGTLLGGTTDAITAATSPSTVITKGYADENYVPKVSTPGNVRVYAIGTTGTQSILNVSSGNQYESLVYRDANGRSHISDPTADTHIVNKQYADAHYVPLDTNPSALAQVYGKNTDGTFIMYLVTPGASYNTIPLRIGRGLLIAGELSEMEKLIAETGRTNFAISKDYGDAHYVPLKSNTTTLNQVYAKTPSGEQTMVNMGVGAESGGIAVRDTSGQIRLPNQISNPPIDNMAVSKAYVDNAIANAGGGEGGGVYMHRIRFDLGGEHAFLYVEIYNTSSVASLEVFDVLSTLSNSIFPKMAIFYDTLSHETASAVILSAIPGTQTITYSISGKQTVDTAQFDSNAQVDDQVKPLSDLN